MKKSKKKKRILKEIWKPIAEYEGLYEVSNMGYVRRACDSQRCKKGDILTSGLISKGYLRIMLHKNGTHKRFPIHLFVLKTFIGPCPKGKEASHLNDIKTDNRLENLQWMTHSENMRLSFKNGRTSSMLGKHHSLRTRRKISRIAKLAYKKGRINPFYGKHHTEETKRKMAARKRNLKGQFT